MIHVRDPAPSAGRNVDALAADAGGRPGPPAGDLRARVAARE
jgi:hypothetical protein